MPRGRRVALAVATAWHVVWIFVFAFAILLFAAAQPDGRAGDDMAPALLLLVAGHLLTFALVAVLIVLYCVHAFRNPRLDS